jgi:hypothetical protein
VVRATADPAETQRFDLKSLAGAYVVVKRLTYGDKIVRRAMTAKMKVLVERGKKDFEGEMALMNEQATLFDFQKCIVEHNLTKPSSESPDDESADVPLNLANAADVRLLNPQVGEEIDNLLNDLNNWEEDEGN